MTEAAAPLCIYVNSYFNSLKKDDKKYNANDDLVSEILKAELINDKPNDNTPYDDLIPKSYTDYKPDSTVPVFHSNVPLRDELLYYQHSFENFPLHMRVINYKEMAVLDSSEMKNAEKRLATFSGGVVWPSNLIPAINLATAGFKFHKTNEAICVYCRKVLNNEILQKKYANVMELHRQMNINCPFILGINVNDDPLTKRDDPQADKLKISMPFDHKVTTKKRSTPMSTSMKYPKYADEDVRFESYIPDKLMLPYHKLVEEGFFFETSKSAVVCFSCGYLISEENLLLKSSGEQSSTEISCFHKDGNNCAYRKHYAELSEYDSKYYFETGNIYENHPAACKRINANRLNDDLLRSGVLAEIKKSLKETGDLNNLITIMRLNLFGCANVFDEGLTSEEIKMRVNKALQYVRDENEIVNILNEFYHIDDNSTIVEDTENENEQVAAVVKNADDELCRVCFTYTIDVVLNPCFHYVCCSQCVKRLTICPVCRQSIVKPVKLSLDDPTFAEHN